MRITFDPRAADDLICQIDYLIDRDAPQAAAGVFRTLVDNKNKSCTFRGNFENYAFRNRGIEWEKTTISLSTNLAPHRS